MTVIKVEGRNLREALEKAKSEFGDGAVVISRKRSPGRVTLAVSEAAPRSPVDLLGMRQQARSLLASKVDVNHTNTAAIRRCLTQRGASPTLIQTICQNVQQQAASGAHPLDLAGAELARSFPVAKGRHEAGRTTLMAFVGASGAGKTTSLAKLAYRLVQTGRKVALVTLDVYRVGAVEQVRAMGKNVHCKTLAARDVLQLRSLLQREDRPDLILLDSTGRPDKDGEALRRLQMALREWDEPVDLQVFLVAEATMRPMALEEELQRMGPLPFAGAILTKTDETRRPAPVMEYLAKKGLGLAFLSNGRDLKEDFHRAGGDAFANLMLKGRVQ